MKGRLHAYEVLLRVAAVRETRASVALAEATREACLHQSRYDDVAMARDAVSHARYGCVDDSSRVDMARYELLANLQSALTERLHDASRELVVAEQACRECASATVLAKRYREQVDDRVDEIGSAMRRELAAKRQEEAVEMWVGGKRR